MKKFVIFLIVLVYSCLLADGVEPLGSGTEIDPYQVETLDNLLWVSTNSSSWGSHFIQTLDIDATDTQNWNTGEGFSPIGNIENNFTGTYNGQSYSIDGLFIDRSEAANQGLFGRITDSDIENIILSDFYVTGEFNTAGLVAHAYNSTINTCYVQGSAEGETHVSGLIGIGEGCTISYCESYSNIIGFEFLGGIIGQCYQSTADNCSSYGYVEGIGNLGGWAGIVFESQIINCFSHSDIDAFMSAGGFSGVIMQNSTIDKCYSIGSIVGGVADIGGLIGMNLTSTVTNSFWDMESSEQSESDGGTGKTTYEMQDVATYTDLTTVGLNDPWDFMGNPYDDTGNYDFWNIDNGYPFLVTEQIVDVEEPTITNSSSVITNLRNYPNPFNPTTTISFSLNTEITDVTKLFIYNVKGQKVKQFVIDQLSSGQHSVVWDGKDDVGKSVASGIYYYKMNDDKFQETKKMILIK